jgi:hypothetical protein
MLSSSNGSKTILQEDHFSGGKPIGSAAITRSAEYKNSGKWKHTAPDVERVNAKLRSNAERQWGDPGLMQDVDNADEKMTSIDRLLGFGDLTRRAGREGPRDKNGKLPQSQYLTTALPPLQNISFLKTIFHIFRHLSCYAMQRKEIYTILISDVKAREDMALRYYIG